MSAPPPSIPDYQMLTCIGRGGYGEVWLARGVTGLHRAVKVVYRAGFSDDRPYEREFSGIKKFQVIGHAQENLVNILHVGRNDPAGYFFYVMELADPAGAIGPGQVLGSDLDVGGYCAGTLKQMLRTRGRLPVSECIPIAKGLARAVEHLHANGLIHRDIKPSNVIFVNGVPKLADIGLVAGLDETRSFVGTEGFVPPDGPGTVASDVFALGRLIYEMATGRDRMEYPNLPEGFEQFDDRAALLEFNEIILKAGDADRSRRYETAGDIVRDLALLEAGKSVRRLRLLETRFALALRTAAVAVTVTLVAVAAWLWATFQAREARRNFADSERHRLEAEAALRDVLLNQVRANRQSGWAGQRLESLRLLRENPAMTNSLAFRNEAIACLSLPDVRPFRTVGLPKGVRLAIDRQLTTYATNNAAGSIFVRAVSDDRLLHYLPTIGAGVFRFGFSEDDRRIGASYLNRRFVAWDLERFPAPAVGQPFPAWTNLADNIRPKRVLLPAGSTFATGLPDGSALAVVTQTGGIQFINPTNGVLLRTLTNTIAGGLRFNAGGTRFASVRSNDCVIHRTETGETLHSLSHPASVTSMAWHPDGRHLATSCYDFKVRLWDTVSGQQIGAFEDHEAEAITVEFDSTGTVLASSSWDTTTRLWAPASARPLVKIRGGGNGLRLAANGTRLAYSTFDGLDLVFLEVLPGRELVSFERFRGIYHLTFSPDARFLAAGSADGLHVWQWPFFHPVATLPVRECVSAVFSSDGSILYSGARGSAIEWPFRPEPGEQRLGIGPTRDIAPVTSRQRGEFRVSPSNRLAALISEERAQLMRRSDSGGDWELESTVEPRVRGIQFSPDDRWIAVSRSSEKLELHDRMGNIVATFSCSNAVATRFSPDGKWIVLSDRDGYRAYRVGTWEPGPLIAQRTGRPRSEAVSFARDADIAAVRTSDREVTLVQVDSWQPLATLPVPLSTMATALSPDGRFLGVGTEKLGPQVWDLALVRTGLAAMGLDWASRHPVPVPGGTFEPLLTPLVQVDLPRVTNDSPAIAARIPARFGDAPPEWIDLGNYYNASLPDGWMAPSMDFGAVGPGDMALPIPLGTNTWAGVNFDVRGAIQLGNPALKGVNAGFSNQVSGIPIARCGRKLHLLLGTHGKARAGSVVGGIAVRFASGNDEIVPITYGRDVYDWWQDMAAADLDGPGRPVVAWEGTTPLSRRSNATLRVYRFTWENPYWDVPIQAIDLFATTRTPSAPFVLAVTVE